MSQVLAINDSLYDRLENTARSHGLNSVEQLLEIWQAREDDLKQRQAATHEIQNLRDKLYSKYGEMPDSTVLIREDRER